MKILLRTILPRLLLLFLLLQPAPPPPFAALWAGPGQARISWTQPPGVALSCLYRNATLIKCFSDAAPGQYVVTLGSVGALDGNLRSAAGDTYVLSQDGVTTRAGLRWAVSLPLVTKPPIVGDRRLWLAWVGR